MGNRLPIRMKKSNPGKDRSLLPVLYFPLIRKKKEGKTLPWGFALTEENGCSCAWITWNRICANRSRLRG